MKTYRAIEPSRYGDLSGLEYSVYEFGSYERHSVNYGLTRKTFLDGFETLEEARAAYPDADVSEGIRTVETDPGPFAPDWFDESAAGERWDDDY